MSWGGPHRRYSYTGASPPAAVAGPTLTPAPLASPRYAFAAAQSPLTLPSGSPASTPPASHTRPSSPWGRQGSEAPASPADASTAAADEEQMQSIVSALRVALGKKEAALVSVAGQLANLQGRLAGCEGERCQLAVQLRDLQLATGSGGTAPDRLPAAGLTPEGRLLAQARQELGMEAARAVELAAERDALQHDVTLLQHQLTAAAQAEAMERERLCNEAMQSRLLARARARHVEQLQADVRQAAGASSRACAAAAQGAQEAEAQAASARQAAAQAVARADAAEALAVQLRQQLENAQATGAAAEARASQVDAELSDARQQVEWQALRLAELEQSSTAGQLMRRYEGEVQRLRAQHEAERRDLQQQLAQAQQQQQARQQQQHVADPQSVSPAHSSSPGGASPGLDNAAWAALFEEPSSSQQEPAADMLDACVQTEVQQQQQQGDTFDSQDLLTAARLEIERLQEQCADLMDAHAHAQHALAEQQRHAASEAERQHAVRHAEASAQQLALEAAQRAEAGLRQQLMLSECQLEHQSREVLALREANEKLELAAAALKEELDGAGHMVPAEEVQQLRGDLQRAVDHTAALEAQVQQLKQQAAATGQEHACAVQQQEQRGAAEAAAQVGAAVQAAAARHEQQVSTLQAQLAEAQQQLQVTRSSLSELVHEQLLRQESMRDASVQAVVDAQPAAAAAATAAAAAAAKPPPLAVVSTGMQTSEAGWGRGVLGLAAPDDLVVSVPRPDSRGGNACGSPTATAYGRQSPTQPVAVTAKQLQLELARVKISTPLRPLPGSGRMRAGGRQVQAHAPSRLGSAFGEHTWNTTSSSLEVYGQLGSGLKGSSAGAFVSASSSSPGGGRLLEDEEDEEEACYGTPLAQTPTAQTPEVSPPLGGASCKAAGLKGWGSTGRQQQQQPLRELSPSAVQHHQQQQQQQYGRQAGAAAPVPALDLRWARPTSSLSCDSLSSELAAGCGCSALSSPKHLLPLAEPSASVSSLSSIGPSASLLSGWTPSLPPAASSGLAGGWQHTSGGGLMVASTWEARGAGSNGGQGNFVRSSAESGARGYLGNEDDQLYGRSWQSERLDASLARLAALTSGLTGGGSSGHRV